MRVDHRLDKEKHGSRMVEFAMRIIARMQKSLLAAAHRLVPAVVQVEDGRLGRKEGKLKRQRLQGLPSQVQRPQP